jgi:hypothetical protein
MVSELFCSWFPDFYAANTVYLVRVYNYMQCAVCTFHCATPAQVWVAFYNTYSSAGCIVQHLLSVGCIVQHLLKCGSLFALRIYIVLL